MSGTRFHALNACICEFNDENVPSCEGYTQHKPEVVDYCEPFCDFLLQILEMYAPKRKFLKKLQLSRPYCKSFADSWPPCCFH